MANLKIDIGFDKTVERFGTDDVVNAVVKIQDSSEAYSACGGCIFGFWYVNQIVPWVQSLNAITGQSYTVESWVQAGERIFSLKRKFNMECGITKEDDTLGPRFFIPITKGGTKQNIPPLDELLPKYYNLRGWDSEGNPP